VHLTAPSHWSRSVGTGGRDASERLGAITGMRTLGRKASDEFAVRLCRTHHRAAHGAGDERAWRKSAGMDPVKVARKLWKDTRANKAQTPRHSYKNLSLFFRTAAAITSIIMQVRKHDLIWKTKDGLVLLEHNSLHSATKKAPSNHLLKRYIM
jgi:hypothetical protein